MPSNLYFRPWLCLALVVLGTLPTPAQSPRFLFQALAPSVGPTRTTAPATPGGSAEVGGVIKPLSNGSTLTFCTINGETTANLTWDAAPGPNEQFEFSPDADFTNVIPFQPAQLSEGTWYVRVFDIQTEVYSAVLSFTIAFTEGIEITDVLVTPVACSMGGAVDLSVSGGSGNYSYLWTNDANATTYTTQDLSGLSSANYHVLVTELVSGCTTEQNVLVPPAEPLAIVGSPTASNVVCPGGTEGEIQVTVQGGSGRYQFSKNGGGAYEPATPTPETPSALSVSYTFTGLSAGTYSIRVKDSQGCESEAVAVSILATDNVPPTFAALSPLTATTDPNLCTATVSVTTPTVSDNCPNPGSASGSRSDNLALGDLYPKGNTTITWTATDNNGNTATATQTVTVTDNQAPTITAPANVAIFTDPNVCTASGVALGSPAIGDNCPGSTVQSNAPGVFAKGITTVTWTVTDLSGNTATATQTVTVTDNQAPATPILAALAGCSVTLSPPSTSDNCAGPVTGTTADPTSYTAPGSYTVTWSFSDGNGNTSTATQSVTVYAKPTLGFTASSGSSSGSASSASGPASLSVSICQGGSLTLSGASTTPASPVGMLVQITATSGNVEYQSGAISPQANPSDVSPSALTGFFGTNGAYTLSSGNTGTITQTYTPYFDANQNDAYDAGIDCLGDPITLQYTITRLTASASVTTPVACFGGTGVLTVVAAGGTGPLTYSRDGSNFQSNPAFTLTEGTYTFTVKDANGCTGTTIPILLGQPPVLALGAASTTNPTCNGASDGSISQPASGGTGLLTYTLSPGGTTNNTGTFTGLGAGEYTVSVSDANACSVTSSTLTLTDPAVPTLGFTAASAGGSSSASSVNGAASVSVAICTGSGSLTLSGLSRSGNRVGTLVVVAASSGNVLFQGNPFAANPTPAVVIPSAMPAFFSTSYAPYTLSSGFQGTVEQVYTPFFDVNENDQYDPGVDCLGSPITLNYTINATPVLSVTNPAAVCSPGTVNLTAAAITAGSALPPGTTLAYFTDAGASNALASPNAVVNSGTYYIRATSPAGCLDINPVVVTINPLPTPSITGLASAYCKDAPAVTLTGLGSPSGGTFRIDGGATTTVLNPANLAAGPHTVVYSVTNANNCTNTASQTVTINALPTPTITGLAGSYCQNASPVALAALGTPSGGAFTISGNASPFTQLTPSTLTPGTTYTVTYTYTNPSTTCTGTTTQTVTITPATITSPATVTGTPVCAGQSVTFTFNVNCPTNASFTAELSDAAGNFPGANLGSVTPGASNVLSIPGTTPTGTGYKIRVLGTNPSLSSVSGTFTVTAGVFNGAPVLAANQTICANQTITFSFAIGACPFPPGNVFTAQLSDAAGNFGGSPTSLGTVTPGSNTVQIPYTVPTGTTYRIRVVSSLPVATSPSSPVTFKVTSLAFSSNPTTNQTPVCAGQNFTVSFTTTNCPYLPGNVFTAELSDAAGNFGSPVSLGTVTPGINTPVTIPQNTSASSNYRVRIVSTLPAQTSAVSAFFQVRVPAFSGLPTVSLAPVCRGQAVRVSFGISCVYFGDNTFTAQLSDATGGFGSPVNLGTVVPAANNLVTIPVATAVGTGYKIRIVSSNPVVTSTASTSFQVKSCTNTREAAPDPEYPGLQVRVSPNPAPEGKLRISVSGAEGQRVGLELFNSQGQRVRQQLIERAGEVDFLDWDLARQPGGLYLLRVSGKQEARTVKVMH